ncbi:DUF6761 family protein [[Phormidium] sp. ETS-05]|uniref:DUF6761 family protein n=1 Tax=[Phormidium] sp. ETS-05 TaxID=222819 RepID=UPI0018EEF304|nr:DUF6761 family protein [[Phormidium] sp. ETS-05]
MLQDTTSIRYYQKLSDGLVELWNKGYRFDDLRMYLDGYMAALRQANAVEPYLLNRLEEDAMRFLYDQSNFEMPEPQREADYY